MTSKLKALVGCSSYSLQGEGEHIVSAPLQATQLVLLGGPLQGHLAWSNLLSNRLSSVLNPSKQASNYY